MQGAQVWSLVGPKSSHAKSSHAPTKTPPCSTKIKNPVCHNQVSAQPNKIIMINKLDRGTSLGAQWLRLYLPVQQVQVWSLVGKLGSHMPCSQKATTEQKQCCKKFNKDFKKVVHIKKKNSKIGNKWEIGIDIYILLNIKWITNRDLLIV